MISQFDLSPFYDMIMKNQNDIKMLKSLQKLVLVCFIEKYMSGKYNN